jgi:hypothetical protein
VALTLLIAGLLVDVWLLIVIHRQGVRKQLPWFALYVAWGVVLVSVQLAAWAINPRLYVAVYWWMEAIAVVLIVGAVRESFLRIFMGFTKMPWFRWAVSGVIAAVVAYSAWKAIYVPPVQGTRLTSFVIGAEFMFRWGIAAIGALTMLLSWLLNEPTNTREDGVVNGFALASGAFVVATVIVSISGTKYLFFIKYLPSVGYFLAVFLWIWVFSRPVEGFGFKELGMGPEDMLKEIRRYREAAQRIRGK